MGREDGHNEMAPPARSPLSVDIDNPEVVKEGKIQTNEKLLSTSAKLQFLTSTSFLTTTIPNSFNPTTRFPLRVGHQVQPADGTIQSKVQPADGTIRSKVQPAAGTQGQPAENRNLQPAVKYRQSEQLFKAKYKQSRFQQRNRIRGEILFPGIAELVVVIAEAFLGFCEWRRLQPSGREGASTCNLTKFSKSCIKSKTKRG